MSNPLNELAGSGLMLISAGTFGKIAQLADDYGNTITFAEPSRSK